MKILIAEDNITSRKILESTLKKWGYEITSVNDGETAWNILQSEDIPMLVIFDWIMPGMDGIEVCKKIRQQNRKFYIYIILLTSKSEKDDIIRGLDSGADDYIIKPFYPHELKARINAGKRIVELHTKLNAAQEALKFQATHDPLTNILNRSSIINSIQKEISRSYRSKSPLSLIIIDLDHFKNINDNYGHIIGDEVLVKVSIRISSTIRDYDSFGRYGGEEFLVVLPNCGKEENLIIGERIRASIEETPIKTTKGKIKLTASLGISKFEPDKIIDKKILIHAADTALYRAKNSGRNCLEIAKKEDYKELSD